MNQWGLVSLKAAVQYLASYGRFLPICPVSSHLVSGTAISYLRFLLQSYFNFCICKGVTISAQLRRQKNLPILVVFESSENGKILAIGLGFRKINHEREKRREDGKLDSITEH